MGSLIKEIKNKPNEEAGRREIKKHAATIHCSNSLSLLQRKITNALLYHAYPELMIKEEHEITVKQLCKLIGYQGHNHAVIKDALKGLLSTVIEWNLINDKTGSEDWTASSILASVSLQGPLCYFAYSPRMKQLLHSPSMFGRIDLFIQSQFRSSYGLALYENCIRYRGLPVTKWIDISTFRKLMGVPPDKYPIFRDFKKRVLDKSVEEVNAYSDLVVEPELQREGRQISKIRFLLKERTKKTRIGGTKSVLRNEEQGLNEKLIQHYGFAAVQAEQLLKEYPAETILEKINLIESSNNYRQGRVQNLSAYLISALRFDYQEPTSKKTTNSTSVKFKKEEESYLLKRQWEEIHADYQNYRNQVIDHTFENLAEQDRAAFLQRFYDHAHVAISTVLHLQRKKYRPETVLTSPQIKAILRQFIEQELILDDRLSLDNYLETLAPEKRSAWQKFEEKGE